MVFKAALYLSLSVCIVGMLYRMGRWFTISLGPDVMEISTGTRLKSACKGILYSLFGLKIFYILKIVILDIFLQARLFRTNIFRWFFHMAIFYAFLMLVLMHAMDESITAALFPDYAATLNPFMFLRNLFGAMVIAGTIFFILRRAFQKKFHAATNRTDIIAILLLLMILISGFFLEAVQIFSSPVFDQMVLDYMDPGDPVEVVPLQYYWAEEYGVVFSGLADTDQSTLLSEGQLLHEEFCAACHSRPTSAFVSYPLSVSLRSFAVMLNKSRVDLWLWYVHFLTCFIGIAYLPFSKFFHIFSVPVNLMIQSGSTLSESDDRNKPVKRSIGMDACTHCGVCSLHCSVMPIYRLTSNSNVLPSEKLISIQAMALGRQLDEKLLMSVSQGSFACTNCYRCTSFCPSGIQLHDLWQASKNDLIQNDFSDPHLWVREASASEWTRRLEQCGSPDISETIGEGFSSLSKDPETFSACVQCTICSNVCPVVSAPIDASPPEMTPQQVMNLLRLDLKELAMGSRMVWDCMTCYMCQEHCPQEIKVADILYELRNMGAKRLSAVRTGRSIKTKHGSDRDEPLEGS